MPAKTEKERECKVKPIRRWKIILLGVSRQKTLGKVILHPGSKKLVTALASAAILKLHDNDQHASLDKQKLPTPGGRTVSDKSFRASSRCGTRQKTVTVRLADEQPRQPGIASQEASREKEAENKSLPLEVSWSALTRAIQIANSLVP